MTSDEALRTIEECVGSQFRQMIVIGAVSLVLGPLFLGIGLNANGGALFGLGGAGLVAGVICIGYAIVLKLRRQRLRKVLVHSPQLVTLVWVREITQVVNGAEMNRRRQVVLSLSDGREFNLETAVVWSRLGGEKEDTQKHRVLDAVLHLAPAAQFKN